MDTNTSNINLEDKIVRIRRKLLTEVNWIKSRDVSERVIKYVPRMLQYFAIKSTRKDYHPLNDLILMYMDTILDIRKRCPNVQLKEMFDTILPELTEWCGIIAINIGNAPFLLKFFSLWSEIMLNTDKIIQRFAGITKISALTNICETIFKTGHFQTQLNGLELVLRYIKACEEEERKRILEDIIPSQKFQRIRELLYDIDISNFELEGRKFLNEFNMIISDEEPVYSIAVERGYIGGKPIIKPMYEDKVCVLWVDFNSATESISFYCQSTTFSPNTEKWINIEVKFPKEINIERRKCEFHVFANRDDIEVYPHPTPQMFLQPKILFRFIYIERDLSNLQRVISCYNSKKFPKNNIVNVSAECDQFYTGFKTVNTEKNHDNLYVNFSTAEWLAPKLPPPKIETKVRTTLNDLTRENFPQNGVLNYFENVTHINKNQKAVLASKSDISSVQNTSTGNKKLSTEEIISTSDASKVNVQNTITAEKTNDNSNAYIPECNNIIKDSKLNTETNNKDKITKGKVKVGAYKKNDKMNNRNPFKKMRYVTRSSQKVNKPGKSNIETILDDNAIKSGSDETTTSELNFSKTVSKRKLYTPNAAVLLTSSQLSKDRRKYLQEIRKTEKRSSLRLISFVKPLEFSEKDDQVKDQKNSNVFNAPIAGNEEQIQQTVEEYVNNKGYVGIKNSLKCPGTAAKFTPQQQETIQNNLKLFDSIFINSTKKFFKSESTLQIKKLDVYDVKNIEEDPVPAKKGRKRKVKEKNTPSIKINVVPKYIGGNAKMSHSYKRSKCRNLGNMKKVLTTEIDNTDFDKLKEDLNFNTTVKEKPKPVNAVNVLKNRKSVKLKENINYEQSDDSVIKVDLMPNTEPVRITIETAQKALSSKSSNNIQEGNNSQIQQISNQSLKPLSNQPGETSNQALNRNNTSKENTTQRFVRNEVNEIVRYSREMPNLSMALNISFETKNSSDNRHKAKQGNNFEKQTILGDSAQNNSNEINSVGVRIKPEKYTSFDQNLNHNLEKNLERSNCRSSAITVPLEEISTITTIEPNWLLKKFLNSIPDMKKRSFGVVGMNNDQVSCELDFQDDPKKHCLNNFEDDIIDLDSYCSIESNDCNCIEDDTRNVGRKVEKAAKKNLTEVVNIKSPLKACTINDSSEKRKLLNPENKEIVPYKRVRTGSTTDFNSDEIRGHILPNLRRKFHKLFTTIVSDKRINSDFEEIKERLIEKLSNFMTSCERHNLQSFESWKQIQKLLVQIGKEKERFHLESMAAFNQLSRTEEALVELKKISKTKEAEKLANFEKMRSDMKEAVTRTAKAEWETYIKNLTNNIITNIQKHIDFDF